MYAAQVAETAFSSTACTGTSALVVPGAPHFKVTTVEEFPEKWFLELTIYKGLHLFDIQSLFQIDIC